MVILHSSLQNTLGFAVSKCVGTNPGPAHLNWMFREPFALQTIQTSLRTHKIPESGMLHLTRAQQSCIQDLLTSSECGLIVVGLDPLETGIALRRNLKRDFVAQENIDRCIQWFITAEHPKRCWLLRSSFVSPLKSLEH